MMDPKPLNKLEIWVAERSAPIFVTILVLIAIGVGATFWIWHKQGDTQAQVNVLKPQVTKVSKAICDQESLRHPNRARSCAERIRVGLVNCRKVSRCRAAFLAIATYPPPAHPGAPSSTAIAPSSEGGDAFQPSNNGHQQPGPPSGGQPEGSQEASPAPSAPEGGAGAGQGQESPGNGAQGSQGDSSSSGAGVEVCALERTCVGVEVGLDPKGLLP